MTALPLVKDCDSCLDLMCKGDWRQCSGAIRAICVSMEVAEMERNIERERTLERLRDRVGTPDEPHTYETRRVA